MREKTPLSTRFNCHGFRMLLLLQSLLWQRWLLLASATGPAARGSFAPPQADAFKRTPLDEYMAKHDVHYRWHDTGHRMKGCLPAGTWEGAVLNFTSQKWLTEHDVSCSVWTHNIVILTPQKLDFSSTGFLVIGGGSNSGSLPSPTDELLLVAAAIAVETRSAAAVLYQVPNQPCTFTSDDSNMDRREDDIIAFTWRHFVDDVSRHDWPLRLPMTKAAARALDTWQEYSANTLGIQVEKFVVSGASKRGWTAWTLAAVDKRVVGVIPMVMDALNFRPNLHHYFRSLGGWPFPFGPYYDLNLTALMDSQGMGALMDIVDAFTYTSRLTMPKLIVVASNDEFFMPDDSKYYWHHLVGEKHLLILANAEHSLITSLPKLVVAIQAFYLHLLMSEERERECSNVSSLHNVLKGNTEKIERILSETKEGEGLEKRSFEGVSSMPLLRGKPWLLGSKKHRLGSEYDEFAEFVGERKPRYIALSESTEYGGVEWGDLVAEALGADARLVGAVEGEVDGVGGREEASHRETAMVGEGVGGREEGRGGVEGELRCPRTESSWPKMTWKLEEREGWVEVITEEKPLLVVMWAARTARDSLRRDFRWIRANDGNCTTKPVGIGCLQPVFFFPKFLRPKQLRVAGRHRYVAQVQIPKEGYTALFVEVRFKGPKGNLPFIFTTEVLVVPNTFPFPDCNGAECKGTLV